MSDIVANLSNDAFALWLELSEYCHSEWLTEEGLRQIIEVNNGFTGNNILLTEYDFFFFACGNERVTERIIQYLLECFPDAASATNKHGWSPLSWACCNKTVTPSIIELLIDAAPDSLRSVCKKGNTPLHFLFYNRKENETAAMEVCDLLIEKYPEMVRHANDEGDLPIHYAAEETESPEFCRVLIEAYPGSERITNTKGFLPLHCACFRGSLPTVEYLYRLFPVAIGHENTEGLYPIHMAIDLFDRRNPESAVEIMKFLLDCDPNQKLIQFEGCSLLELPCRLDYGDSIIEASLQIINIIYDAHPEAIEENDIVANIHDYHQQVQSFINGELVYARQAKDQRLMTTPDDKGRLPLHTALQNNVRLGSIKLLVKSNPHALQSPDSSGALPLHIACKHHDSVDVVQYLVELDSASLDALDEKGNSALHYACSGAWHDIIALLLQKFDAVSVSKRNAENKLPIDLLWERNSVEDRESVEYTDSVFRLLKAYPETVMSINDDDMTQQAELGIYPENEKKRKWDTVEK